MAYSAIQLLQWHAGNAAQWPVLQFLVIFVAMIAAKKKSTFQFFSRNSGAIKATFGLVAALQFWRQWKVQDQYLKKILKSLQAVETTSQVVATRANVMEWRSCLSMIAKWHSVTPQGAYKLWQYKLGAVPPCPASQWSYVSTGFAMGREDQKIADSDLPSFKVEQLKVEFMIAAYEEKAQLLARGIQLKNAESIMASITKFAAPVEQWKSAKLEEETDVEEAVAAFFAKIDKSDEIFR